MAFPLEMNEKMPLQICSLSSGGIRLSQDTCLGILDEAHPSLTETSPEKIKQPRHSYCEQTDNECCKPAHHLQTSTYLPRYHIVHLKPQNILDSSRAVSRSAILQVG